MEDGSFRTRIKRLRRSMSLTSAIVALAVGVMLPIALSTSVGIVTLAIGETSESIVIGVLVICFAAAAIGSAIVVTVLLGRRARLARLQADLLTNVTHDLRTPLAAIRMYAQTLQMGRLDGDPERTEECLQTIMRETEWLETMVDRVITWRGASQDREALVLETASMDLAVEEAVGRFSRMYEEGEVELEVSIQPTAPVAHDAQEIGALVLNLLINAYKYTGREKRISIEVRDGEGWVEIAVKDNGIGIPEKEVGRIFDPFYRVDPRLRGKSSGAGLGLAIVRHLALAHDGEVFVESEEGQGSRFSVRLPAAAGEDSSK